MSLSAALREQKPTSLKYLFILTESDSLMCAALPNGKDNTYWEKWLGELTRKIAHNNPKKHPLTP